MMPDIADIARHFQIPGQFLKSRRHKSGHINDTYVRIHLYGDAHFMIIRPGHNLDRCRTQVRMVENWEPKSDALSRIVANYR
jgi:hypothetical protein